MIWMEEYPSNRKGWIKQLNTHSEKLEDKRNPNSDHSTVELTFDLQQYKDDIMSYNDITNYLHRDQIKENRTDARTN